MTDLTQAHPLRLEKAAREHHTGSDPVGGECRVVDIPCALLVGRVPPPRWLWTDDRSDPVRVLDGHQRVMQQSSGELRALAEPRQIHLPEIGKHPLRHVEQFSLPC